MIKVNAVNIAYSNYFNIHAWERLEIKSFFHAHRIFKHTQANVFTNDLIKGGIYLVFTFSHIKSAIIP